MQVHHDEGVANRIDPESCASTRGVVLDTGMCARSLLGNREISWSASTSMRAALARFGKARSRSR